MAIEKQLLGRIIHKHDIEESWNKATGFIPKQGEIIVYDIDENYNYERFKIGDGNTSIINLPFQKTNINDLKAISYDIAQTLTDEQKEQARINIGAASIENNKPDWNQLTNKPTEIAGGDTLTWDGNKEGLLAVEEMLYKVSDAVPSLSDFSNGGIFIMSNGTQADFTIENIIDYDGSGVLLLNSGGFYIIPEDNLEFNDMTFPEKGVYFVDAGGRYIEVLTIHGYTGFTAEKLKDSIIPDTVSRVGHTPSFNDLEDKPFYEETTTVQGDTLTWDGNTEGLVTVEVPGYDGAVFARISDAVPTLDDCLNGIIEVSSNGATSTWTHQQLVETFYPQSGVLCTEGITAIPTDNYMLASFGLQFPKAGIYAVSAEGMEHIASLTIPGYTGFVTTETVVKTIDPKFLPEDIAKVSDIDTKLAALVNSAPEKLNTLDELAAALGDDENFANTVTTELSKKANSADLGALASKDSLTASDVGAIANTADAINALELITVEDIDEICGVTANA